MTETTGTVLVVDDVRLNLDILVNTLGDQYDLLVATNGSSALRLARQNAPDLILLDVMMPGIDGFAVLRELQADPAMRAIPVILLTALSETADKTRGFQLGAVDFITKPFQIEEVLARVTTHIKLRRAQQELRGFNDSLQELVARQVEEITRAQHAAIFALAKLSHTRDDDTGLHLERVRAFCRLMAETLAAVPGCAALITPSFIEAIYHASPLHDVGKVGIVDSILLKPGRLTQEEFTIMKEHTLIGARTLEAVLKMYPGNFLIEMGIDIARHHHEKWNGNGYPDGLAGEDIPLSARIMAVADIYDALRARRPYKEPFSHQKAVDIILSEKGVTLDPTIAEVFNTVHPRFETIFAELDDDAG